MKKILPLIVLAGAGLYFFNQFTSLGKTLTIRIGRIAFNLKETQRSFYSKIFADVNLILNNASRVQGAVRGGKIDVMMNGRVVGIVDRIGATNIVAAGETILPILVGLNTLAIVPAIQDLIALIGKGQALKLQFKGTIITSLGNVDIDETQTFSL